MLKRMSSYRRRRRSPPRVWPRHETKVSRQFTLKVNHLNEDIDESDLYRVYLQYGPVSSIKVVSEPIGTFAYVNFTSEEDAKDAYKTTNRKDIFGTGTPVSVVCKWGGAEPTPPTTVQQQFTLKVTHLSPSVTQSELENICSQYNDYQNVKVNQGGYAYVNFVSQNGADSAMKHLNRMTLYGQTPVAKLHNTTAGPSSSPPRPHHPPFPPHPPFPSHHPPHHHPPNHHPPHHHPSHRHPHPPHPHPPPPHHPPHHHPPHHHPPPPPFPHPPHHRPPFPHPPPFTPLVDSDSTTVKVTIGSNDISSEELEMYFSQFGPLLQAPTIRQGSPNYTFIYYKTNGEAMEACKVNKCKLKGVELNMKLSNKRLDTVVESKEVKIIKCDSDPLVSRVLTTCLTHELELGNVTYKPSKDGQGIQLLGNDKEVQLAEMVINLKIELVQTQLTSSTHYLHCSYIPLLGDPSLFQDIETQYAVQFTIVTREGQDKSLLNLSSSMASLLSSSYPITVESINEYLTSDPSYITPHSNVGWEYMDDSNSFTPMNSTDAAAVERLYKSTTTKLYNRDKWQYSYDFTSMIQTNISTGKKRQIKRLIKAAVTGGLTLQIKCRGLPEKVSQSLSDLQGKLNQNMSEKVLSNCSNASVKESMIELASCFCVKIDPSCDDKITLSGSSEYLAKVLLVLSEKQYQLLAQINHSISSSSGATSFPPEWEITSDSKNVELKQVPRTSSEWRCIEDRMKTTIPNIVIVTIQRIQNKFLYTKYDLCKKRMAEKNGGVVNEERLFHGSRDTTPNTIYESEHGFDFRYGRSGMWGKGAYFAVNASYSKNYAYTKSGSKQMFMAYVLTGNSANIKSNSSLVVPPQGYDSVTGDTHGSKIYIVYDHDKSYPAYLITFM